MHITYRSVEQVPHLLDLVDLPAANISIEKLGPYRFNIRTTGSENGMKVMLSIPKMGSEPYLPANIKVIVFALDRSQLVRP